MHAIIKEAETRMLKSIATFKNEISKLRTGRAHPSLLDHVRVEYYGNEVPINQVANITVSDARTLSITAWEKRMVPIIEKAIHNSDLGLNPSTAGEVIRVAMPSLTEDRRKELIRVVRGEAETARVSIRNVRRDANNSLKDSVKNKTMTEDEEGRLAQNVQKLTDKHIQEVDQILATKETDLLAV